MNYGEGGGKNLISSYPARCGLQLDCDKFRVVVRCLIAVFFFTKFTLGNPALSFSHTRRALEFFTFNLPLYLKLKNRVNFSANELAKNCVQEAFLNEVNSENFFPQPRAI